MNRDTMLVVRLPQNLKEALRRAAKADHRTMSNKVEVILREWLAANDLLTAKHRSER
jgi:hypothetical protein